jgi:hypothetical protein
MITSWRMFKCLFFPWHKLRTVRTYWHGVRRVRCSCGAEYGMNDHVRAFLEWDAELQELHDEIDAAESRILAHHGYKEQAND